MRPENFLVHETTPTSLDPWLCDVGGSKCDGLGVYGGHVPDSGFFEPRPRPTVTTQMDMFSAGSVLCNPDWSLAVLGTWAFQDAGGIEGGWG
ncbi:Protein kinase-like domain protein [Tolypocladium paradoxum]|uniref:Protein kinase-like domain protein n=1 Tax=Tolypocladium paradoxum TaxID=94208 RepID=A0A2S4KTR8_9HYPO|nr:Protein kinase-like domain protein [Tolypocladium paradoxum]